MAVLKVESVSVFRQQVDSLRASLFQHETEESWDAIARSISKLTILCKEASCDFPSEIVATVRGVFRPLNSAMNSERTRLSGVAIDLFGVLASGIGANIEPLLPLFFPTLLGLCARTNKVFVTRSRTSILTIIETSQSPAILPYLLQSFSDKSVSLRLTAIEGVLACMNCFNPPDLEKEGRAQDIESAIRFAARDANADVRKISRKVFEAYKVLLPSRVDNFVAPLSPTTKKYLEIRARSVSSTRSKTMPRPQVTHAKHLPPSRSKTNEMPRGRRGVDKNGNAESGSRTPRAVIPLNMPPPDYIPLKTSKPARQDTSLFHGRSTVPSRQCVTSSSSITPTRHAAISSGVITPASSLRATSEAARRLQLPTASEPVTEMTRAQRSIGPFTRSGGSARPHGAPLLPNTKNPHLESGGELILSEARRVLLQVADNTHPSKPVSRPTTRDNLTAEASKAMTTHRREGVAVGHESEDKEVPRTGEIAKPVPRLTRKLSAPALASKPNSNLDPKLARKPSAPVLASSGNSKPLPRLTRKPSTLTIASSSQAVGEVSKSKSASSLVFRSGDKASGVHKPTISQTARAQAAETERRSAESRTATEKPLWGRAAARKVIPTTRPLSINAKVRATKKPSTTCADGSETTKDKVVSRSYNGQQPAHVPPPPSPPLEVDSEERQTRTPSPTGGQIGDVINAHGPTATSSGELCSEASAERKDTETERSSSPAPTHQLHSLGRTPISSLLTSIQHGFIFTPSSPLSPPESYLHAPTTNRGPPLVFPIRQLQAARNSDEELSRVSALTTVSVKGKLLGEDVDRQVLNDVEVNQNDSALFV